MAVHTKTIRIDDETDKLIGELASELLKTKKDVLKEAVKAYKKELLFSKANLAYEVLREDKAGWAQELEERAVWDDALMDGLEDE